MWQFLGTLAESLGSEEIELCSPWMWIDAICIQQDDVNKRNHQVGFMSSIFRNADLVVVWLGLEIDISQAFINGGIAIVETPWLTIPGSDHPHNLHDYERLRSACERPYWSRLWVVQEIILANNLGIRYGSIGLPWNKLLRAIDWEDGVNIKRLAGTPITPTIVRAIAKGQCENVLDRVYGLLGLIPDDAGIEVDYSKTAEQLLVHVLDKYQITKNDRSGRKIGPTINSI